nr:alpha-hydroxy acid oxidase [Actinopolymorpha alba]
MTTYDELERRAREILPPDIFGYLATGSGVEETLATNDAAWRQFPLRPRILRDVARVDTGTTLLGTPVASPVHVAPTGYQTLAHASGEAGVAKGTADAGSLYVLSTRATASLDEVAAVAGPWWLQVYVLRDRDLSARIVERAAACGARALVLTADTPYVAAKARAANVPVGGSARFLIPELVARDDEGTWQNPSVTFDDIGWLREVSGGLPVVVKGVLRGDDARSCVEAGASALYVSNHGGRQLDGALATAFALAEVRAAVGEECEVYVDGGIRTGRDVVRALALGANAAFVGRPALWALATSGSDGVRDLLSSLHEEVDEALALCGCRSVAEVTPDLVRYP